MDTAGTINPITGKRRRTRSAVSMKPQDHADATGGTTANASSRARTDAPTSLLAVLLDLITRLLSARIPALMGQAKENLVDLFHAKDDGAGLGVQERLADAGKRVVKWGRQHPGQAVAVGAAVLTAAVLIGTMLHRSQAEAGGRPSLSAAAKRRRKSRKAG